MQNRFRLLNGAKTQKIARYGRRWTAYFDKKVKKVLDKQKDAQYTAYKFKSKTNDWDE